jgi:tRNA U34 5-carboxymethylaminomethyl modifying enzyme MnmG/GidA
LKSSTRGIFERQLQEIDKFRHLEQIKLPEAIDYTTVHGLSSELKEKLARFIRHPWGRHPALRA